jgi:Yip1 domain
MEKTPMATTTMPAPEAQPAISPFGRIIGVFFSPKAAFEDIARKPSWVAPILLLTIIGLAMNIFLAQKVDWRSFSEEQLTSSPRGQQIPPDQKDQAIERTRQGNLYFCYVRGVIGTLFLALVLALVYWGAYALIGGARITFRNSFAVVAYAMLPGGLRDLLGIPILMLKDPSTLGNPYNFVGSNPGAYMSLSDPKWLSAMGSSLDIFVLWSVVLTAIGFHSMDLKKLKMSKAMGIAVGVYIFFTLLGTTVAWVFS